MKLILKRGIKKCMVPLFEGLAVLSKKFCQIIYRKLFFFEWFIDNPENFDHEIDLYWQWDDKCLPYWLERGIYSIQALKMFEHPIVIELCCGDGFNEKHFYSTSASKVMACDFDEKIIKTAKKKNRRENIVFKVADIRDGINNIFSNEELGDVSNIIWDAAIEHFTPAEIQKILTDIRQTLLKKKGILSGYTIVEKADGKSLEQHEYEFKNMNDLKRFLVPYFENIYVFETIYPDRHNLYFYASDGDIPFGEDWEHGMLSESKNHI